MCHAQNDRNDTDRLIVRMRVSDAFFTSFQGTTFIAKGGTGKRNSYGKPPVELQLWLSVGPRTGTEFRLDDVVHKALRAIRFDLFSTDSGGNLVEINE